MIRMPATSRLIAAIPATARVSTVSISSKALSRLSWLIRVMSSSPSWRSLSAASISRLLRSRKLGPRTSTNTRNNPSRLNKAWALATGMINISAKSIPRDSPRSPRMPTTRKRRSPARNHSPRAGRAPNSSRRSLPPITQTASACSVSSAGRGWPWTTVSWRMAKKSRVVPRVSTSRLRLPTITSICPACSGATRRMPGNWVMAWTSCKVNSCGVRPVSGGMRPVVSLRPGKTIRMSRPSSENSFRTKARAPAPRPVSRLTATTPIAMASSSIRLRERCPRKAPSQKARASAARIR
ncbi:hypothetical protein PS673_04284 [Pseudomonas fluorescens]|uniref:Uncharacterized protein n=1 Tax=Pseudomonas fluorescens TaxID=294 RepID=A0A5E6VQT7_PSEFL|nr:hypothetical protein PS673_04284 [Pseudomonas fluorescens]